MSCVKPRFNDFDSVVTEAIENDFKISAKTAIYRNGPSVPMKELHKRGLIPKEASCLNFGKGKYNHDSDLIRSVSGNCSDYDYTYCRTNILGTSFNFVVCFYVLNTLPFESRTVVWSQLRQVTKQGGVCFIAVRSDKDRAIKGVPYEDGFRTSSGTYQIGFTEEVITNEALQFFANVRTIKASGYRLLECR